MVGHRSQHWLLRVVEPPTVRVPLGKSFLLQTRVVFWRHTCWRWITMIWSQYVSNMSQMCITCVSHVCHMCITCVSHVCHMCVTYVSRLVCQDLRLSHSSCSLVRCMVPLDWAPYTGRYDLITPRSQDGFCVESWRHLKAVTWWLENCWWNRCNTQDFTNHYINSCYCKWCLAEAWSCSIATSLPTAYHLCACHHRLKWSMCFVWSDLMLVFPTE